jgi:hypothetical protein
LKIDARAGEYDDDETDFVCIDLRVLSTNVGAGKGDFNRYDSYLDSVETGNGSETDHDHVSVSGKILEKGEKLENFEQSVGLVIQKNEGVIA